MITAERYRMFHGCAPQKCRPAGVTSDFSASAGTHGPPG
jgi:hypothetical protein